MSTATERVDDIMDSTVTIVMEDTTGGLFCALIHKHHQIRLRKAVVIVFLNCFISIHNDCNEKGENHIDEEGDERVQVDA